MKPSQGILAAILLFSYLQAGDAKTSRPVSLAQNNQAKIAASAPREASANMSEFPKQILKSGINLTAPGLSPNSLQLANTIELTPLLERSQELRSRLTGFGSQQTIESLAARQELYEVTDKIALLIQRTDLEIDFAVAEMDAENQVYQEILNRFTGDRDKAIARTNAIGFISNGALWAVCEALAIPAYKHARFAIPSGIVGIPAGVVPSIASMYTFKQINGKKKTSEVEPNMLAKLFNYPTNPEIEYPSCVWEYLHQVPASDPTSKKRLDQMIDRWIADANIPGFTDRNSKQQLDVITASIAQRKGLSISSLTARSVMLQQLQAEVWKMKRMLLELAMAARNEKQIISSSADDSTKDQSEPKLR
ncbi:MAG: hypothetical protein SGJ27_14140 [Candidatus Melainabacteria bacterium]|nr:hypothetical protein [Candidatus Melainabacteria bacterium]